MLKAGALAYLVKASAFEELALALRAVMSEKVYISPAVAGSGNGKAAARSALETLSSREREVLQLIAEVMRQKKWQCGCP